MNSKILFVLDKVTDNFTAGGLLYDQIANSLDKENISVIGFSHSIVQKKDLNKTLFAIDFPNYNIFWKLLKKVPLIEPFYILLKRFLIKKRVLNHVKSLNPSLVFFKLRGNPLLFINDITSILDIPFFGMIEDTVEREIDGHFSLYLIKRYLYYKAIPTLNRVGVAGETMQKYIINSFNIDAVIIRPWYNKEFTQNKKLNPNKINIFFGGNIYAKKELIIFIKALDLIASNNKRIKITFIIASKRVIKYKTENFIIKQIGWVDYNTLTSYMSGCNFAYLPYISDKKQKHSMMYAFPGKAGLYIANNLPIIFHGPSYSSFNSFLEKYKVGISTDLLNHVALAKVLKKKFEDTVNYSYYLKFCQIAYTKEYSKNVFDKHVKDLFSI